MRNNLSPESALWGREVDRRLTSLENAIQTLTQDNTNAFNGVSGSLAQLSSTTPRTAAEVSEISLTAPSEGNTAVVWAGTGGVPAIDVTTSFRSVLVSFGAYIRAEGFSAQQIMAVLGVSVGGVPQEQYIAEQLSSGPVANSSGSGTHSITVPLVLPVSESGETITNTIRLIYGYRTFGTISDRFVTFSNRFLVVQPLAGS